MADDDSVLSDDGTGRNNGLLFFVDPLQFSVFLFSMLVLFVFYLLLPRGVRKQYFGAYPKRHAWSTRSRRRSELGSMEGGSYTGGSSILGAGTTYTATTTGHPSQMGMGLGNNNPDQTIDLQQNDEIVISAAMQQLRDPGVLIVAHGSRGKPKTVRLQLTESAITWRTETRKKIAGQPPKMGKLHQVPLQHIMYVDVGKQTTALRRVENASVAEHLCFSLLTKEGSLDLEANSPRERDALVSCFSLVLDEVHAQNWRDIYRGPSSDMPSSFDEMDPNKQSHQQGN